MRFQVLLLCILLASFAVAEKTLRTDRIYPSSLLATTIRFADITDVSADRLDDGTFIFTTLSDSVVNVDTIGKVTIDAAFFTLDADEDVEIKVGNSLHVDATNDLALEGEFVSLNSFLGSTLIRSVGGPIEADAQRLLNILADEFYLSGEGGVKVISPAGPINFEADDIMSTTSPRVILNADDSSVWTSLTDINFQAGTEYNVEAQIIDIDAQRNFGVRALSVEFIAGSNFVVESDELQFFGTLGLDFASTDSELHVRAVENIEFNSDDVFNIDAQDDVFVYGRNTELAASVFQFSGNDGVNAFAQQLAIIEDDVITLSARRVELETRSEVLFTTGSTTINGQYLNGAAKTISFSSVNGNVNINSLAQAGDVREVVFESDYDCDSQITIAGTANVTYSAGDRIDIASNAFSVTSKIGAISITTKSVLVDVSTGDGDALTFLGKNIIFKNVLGSLVLTGGNIDINANNLKIDGGTVLLEGSPQAEPSHTQVISSGTGTTFTAGNEISLSGGDVSVFAKNTFTIKANKWEHLAGDDATFVALQNVNFNSANGANVAIYGSAVELNSINSLSFLATQAGTLKSTVDDIIWDSDGPIVIKSTGRSYYSAGSSVEITTNADFDLSASTAVTFSQNSTGDFQVLNRKSDTTVSTAALTIQSRQGELWETGAYKSISLTGTNTVSWVANQLQFDGQRTSFTSAADIGITAGTSVTLQSSLENLIELNAAKLVRFYTPTNFTVSSSGDTSSVGKNIEIVAKNVLQFSSNVDEGVTTIVGGRFYGLANTSLAVNSDHDINIIANSTYSSGKIRVNANATPTSKIDFIQRRNTTMYGGDTQFFAKGRIDLTTNGTSLITSIDTTSQTIDILSSTSASFYAEYLVFGGDNAFLEDTTYTQKSSVASTVVAQSLLRVSSGHQIFFTANTSQVGDDILFQAKDYYGRSSFGILIDGGDFNIFSGSGDDVHFGAGKSMLIKSNNVTDITWNQLQQGTNMTALLENWFIALGKNSRGNGIELYSTSPNADIVGLARYKANVQLLSKDSQTYHTENGPIDLWAYNDLIVRTDVTDQQPYREKKTGGIAFTVQGSSHNPYSGEDAAMWFIADGNQGDLRFDILNRDANPKNASIHTWASAGIEINSVDGKLYTQSRTTTNFTTTNGDFKITSEHGEVSVWTETGNLFMNAGTNFGISANGDLYYYAGSAITLRSDGSQLPDEADNVSFFFGADVADMLIDVNTNKDLKFVASRDINLRSGLASRFEYQDNGVFLAKNGEFFTSGQSGITVNNTDGNMLFNAPGGDIGVYSGINNFIELYAGDNQFWSTTNGNFLAIAGKNVSFTAEGGDITFDTSTADDIILENRHASMIFQADGVKGAATNGIQLTSQRDIAYDFTNNWKVEAEGQVTFGSVKSSTIELNVNQVNISSIGDFQVNSRGAVEVNVNGQLRQFSDNGFIIGADQSISIVSVGSSASGGDMYFSTDKYMSLQGVGVDVTSKKFIEARSNGTLSISSTGGNPQLGKVIFNSGGNTDLYVNRTLNVDSPLFLWGTEVLQYTYSGEFVLETKVTGHIGIEADDKLTARSDLDMRFSVTQPNGKFNILTEGARSSITFSTFGFKSDIVVDAARNLNAVANDDIRFDGTEGVFIISNNKDLTKGNIQLTSGSDFDGLALGTLHLQGRKRVLLQSAPSRGSDMDFTADGPLYLNSGSDFNLNSGDEISFDADWDFQITTARDSSGSITQIADGTMDLVAERDAHLESADDLSVNAKIIDLVFEGIHPTFGFGARFETLNPGSHIDINSLNGGATWNGVNGVLTRSEVLSAKASSYLLIDAIGTPGINLASTEEQGVFRVQVANIANVKAEKQINILADGTIRGQGWVNFTSEITDVRLQTKQLSGGGITLNSLFGSLRADGLTGVTVDANGKNPDDGLIKLTAHGKDNHGVGVLFDAPYSALSVSAQRALELQGDTITVSSSDHATPAGIVEFVSVQDINLIAPGAGNELGNAVQFKTQCARCDIFVETLRQNTVTGLLEYRPGADMDINGYDRVVFANEDDNNADFPNGGFLMRARTTKAVYQSYGSRTNQYQQGTVTQNSPWIANQTPVGLSFDIDPNNGKSNIRFKSTTTRLTANDDVTFRAGLTTFAIAQGNPAAGNGKIQQSTAGTVRLFSTGNSYVQCDDVQTNCPLTFQAGGDLQLRAGQAYFESQSGIFLGSYAFAPATNNVNLPAFTIGNRDVLIRGHARVIVAGLSNFVTTSNEHIIDITNDSSMLIPFFFPFDENDVYVTSTTGLTCNQGDLTSSTWLGGPRSMYYDPNINRLCVCDPNVNTLRCYQFS